MTNWRTDRLVASLPDVYAAGDPGALLHRLLDAFGRELVDADAQVNALLRSHWVQFASGAALDGLGATFGVERRVLADGEPEADEAFRRRLRSLVSLFTGGGTVRAVVGAVQSALGLPFDLDDLALPPSAEGLREDLRCLVRLTEFSPDETEVRASAAGATVEAERTRLDLEIDLGTARPEPPRLDVLPRVGVARNLSVELVQTGEGVRAASSLAVDPDEALVLEMARDGTFSARVDGPQGSRGVTHLLTALDGGAPTLPPVPAGRSTWVVRAGSGFAGSGDAYAAFDEDTFDLPRFDLRMRWVVAPPLSFEVSVPYRLRDAVAALSARYGFTEDVFVFSGLPRERLQDVVDQTRAAGVQGRVSFSLTFADDHAAGETVTATVELRSGEEAGAREGLTVGSLQALPLRHEQEEALRIAGVFDFSTFDDPHQGFAS
jgi:hypothetical protein